MAHLNQRAINRLNERLVEDWEDRWLDPDYDMSALRYRDYDDEEGEEDIRGMTEEEFIEYSNRITEECNETLRRIGERIGLTKGTILC